MLGCDQKCWCIFLRRADEPKALTNDLAIVF
jgi:hypothetical protein